MMRKQRLSFQMLRPMHLVGIVLTLLLAIGVAGTADARKKTKEGEEEDQTQFTLSESMSKKLTTAMEAIQADPPEYAKAEETLKALERRSKRLKPYENALVYQFLGHVESGQDRYPEALVYFEKCLVLDALPIQSQLQTRFNVAQLYIVTEQFQEAVDTLKKWFEEASKPTSAAYYMLAIAYYQLDEIEEAIVPAETSVRIAKKPKEAWLQLLIGLYYESKQYEKAVDPLKAVLIMNPKKTYWKQLSSLYAHIGEENASLAVMQLAYDQGFLDIDRDLRSLAQLYLFSELPYRAARVIDKGFNDGIVEPDVQSYEMLANSWLHAKEYDAALEPLERGAELSPAGVLYQRLGAVHIERERWGKASDALEKALGKGELDNPGNAHLLCAIAFYHQGKFQISKKQLRLAREFEKSRDSAIAWMQLIDREIARLAALEDE
jgi:tetratricopeptide (TPR) repeat protein